MIFTPATWETSPGLTNYDFALERMQKRAGAIRESGAEELVWLVEHPPLYTAGTSAKPEDLQDSSRFPTYTAGRGGQWTYHGPGQRVAYVMLDLTRPHGTIPARDVRCYVAGLERWVSWHGLALNVNPDLSHFTGIVPCGIREHGVTSLHDLGVKVSMDEVDAALRRNWSKVFG